MIAFQHQLHTVPSTNLIIAATTQPDGRSYFSAGSHYHRRPYRYETTFAPHNHTAAYVPEQNLTLLFDDLYEPSSSPLPRWWALSAFVLVLGTAAGNVLVCLAIYWERRLQNVTNYFLMSLAITDLMVAVLVMPMGILALVQGKHYPCVRYYWKTFAPAISPLESLFNTRVRVHRIPVFPYVKKKNGKRVSIRARYRRRNTPDLTFIYSAVIFAAKPITGQLRYFANTVYPTTPPIL